MEIIRNSVQTEHYCLYGVFFLHAPNVCAIINEKNMCSIKRKGETCGLFLDSERKDIV